MPWRKILVFMFYAGCTVALYLTGIVVAVNIYVHNQKQYIPATTAAQATIKYNSPTPTPSWSYTPEFYPTAYYPNNTPSPTMGIPPGPTPCTTKKCD